MADGQQPYNPFAGGMWSMGGMALGANPYVDPSMMDPSMMSLGPQMGIAQSMMQEGVSTAPTLSPWAGISRLAGALLGRNMMQSIGQQYQKAQSAMMPSDDTINTMVQGDPGMMKLWAWAKDHPYQRQQVLNQIVNMAGTRASANIDLTTKSLNTPMDIVENGHWTRQTPAEYASRHGGQYPPGYVPPSGVYSGTPSPGVAPQSTPPVPTGGTAPATAPATGTAPATAPATGTTPAPTQAIAAPTEQPMSVSDLQKKYPEAINAPPDVQERAAIAFYRHYGGAPWHSSQPQGVPDDPVPPPSMTDDQIRQRLQGIAFRESGSRLGGAAQEINNVRNASPPGTPFAGQASGVYQFMPKSWQEALGLAYGGQQAPLSNVGKTMIPPPSQGAPPPAGQPPAQGATITTLPPPGASAPPTPPLQQPMPSADQKPSQPGPQAQPQPAGPLGPSAKPPADSTPWPSTQPVYEPGYNDTLSADVGKVNKDFADLNNQKQLQGNIQDLRSLALQGLQTGSLGEFRDRAAGLLKLFGADQKTINDVTGMDPTQAGAVNKIMLQVASQFAKSAGPQTQQVWETVAAAFPNLESQPGAIDMMTNVLDMASRYQSAYTNAESQWVDALRDQGMKTGKYRGLAGGNIEGESFNDWFNKNNPYKAYVAAAKAMTDPSRWTNAEPLKWGDETPVNQQNLVIQLIKQAHDENPNVRAWWYGGNKYKDPQEFDLSKL